MITTLLQPKWLSFRNRWKKDSFRKRRMQDVVVLLFSLCVMFGMFYGTHWALQQMGAVPFLVYLPPSLPIGLILFLLLGMVTISALATSLGNLYLADDVELILATPTSTRSLFLSRFVFTLFTVSWMPLVFLAPVLAAFGAVHHAPLSFYPLAGVILLAFFAVPVALSFLFGSLLMAVIDPRWGKLLLYAGISLGICGIIYLAEALATVLTSRNDPNQVLHFVATLSRANAPYLPSSWAAAAISELLLPTGKDFFFRIILLYSTALGILSISLVSTEWLHGRGYTRAKNTSRGISSVKKVVRSRMLSSPTWALISKEFRSIFRDLAQSTQILFLGCMCLLYLANLRIFISIDSFPGDAKAWWQNVFFIMHTSITAFFTCSICTRVVFSSVSLEGKQFWLLQTAPLNTSEVLRAKLWAWFCPVALISALLFAAGTYVIVGRLDIVVYYVTLSLFISYGIVGLGVGLGATFADFSWDHPSQLALSLGSFIFMLASASLVIINIVPMSVMLRLGLPSSHVVPAQDLAVVLLLALIVASLNVAVAQSALRLGGESLAKVDS